MIKSRNYSLHKIKEAPRIVMFDGDESRYNRRVFREEYSTDKINMCWEYSPMTKENDYFFQKPNNADKSKLVEIVKDSYSLPQVHKRKNQLNNESYMISPQITNESQQKFGKYAKRYTQDSDLFSTKFSSKAQFGQQSSSYGQFYFSSDYKMVKPKPCLNYHSSKSQILGHQRLQNIKLKQEL